MVNPSAAAPAAPQLTDRSPSVMTWAIALGVASLFAWIGYNYPPIHWRIPDDMTHIGALSPPEDQARLRAVEEANRWKNTLLKFSLAGAGIGLAGALLYASSIAKNVKPVVATFISGLLAGAAAGAIGLVVRIYLDKDHPLPLVSDEMRPLFADSVVFCIASIVLLVPVSVLLMMHRSPDLRQKAKAVPLAGLLTGMLVPMSAAMVLSAHSSTSFYPPRGGDLTFIWFVVLGAVTLLLLSMADRKNRSAQDVVA